MKIFFDTEFVENGRSIELISIGMVREDGATYYAERKGVFMERLPQWHQDNVVPHLVGGDALRWKGEIADDIRAFAGDDPEFWAYVGAYDWIVMIQLYGRLLDRPKGWPTYVRELKQLRAMVGKPDLPPQPVNAHHALADARWNRQVYEICNLPLMVNAGMLTQAQADEAEHAIRAGAIL